VFAITDEASARLILSQKSLAAFGRHCTVRAFQDRPPVTQCRNCWRLDHVTHHCKEFQRCRLCGSHHDEKEHPEADPGNCAKCHESGDTMITAEDGQCPHNIQCLNCLANNKADHYHPADARRCPARLDKYGTARENERRAQKVDNPWIKAKPKKPRAKPSISHTPGTSNPTHANRFTALVTPAPQPDAQQSSLQGSEQAAHLIQSPK
jgi:hypothetical protein